MSITTVGDLIDYVRLQLNSEKINDVDTYALWSDAELINYIDQAQQEFSRLTLCIANYSDYFVFLETSKREYLYDSKIIEIMGGYLRTGQKRVYPISFNNFERSYRLQQDILVEPGDWEDDFGIPQKIITDLHLNKLVTWPTPTSSDILNLYVIKEADHIVSTTYTNASNENLEIDSQYRLGLTYRVMSLAYQKADSLETEDLQKATLYSQKWKSFWQDAKKTYDTRFKRV